MQMGWFPFHLSSGRLVPLDFYFHQQQVFLYFLDTNTKQNIILLKVIPI